jgi:hypothetical protein
MYGLRKGFDSSSIVVARSDRAENTTPPPLSYWQLPNNGRCMVARFEVSEHLLVDILKYLKTAINKTNSVAFSPQANYTDRMTAAVGEVIGNF